MEEVVTNEVIPENGQSTTYMKPVTEQENDSPAKTEPKKQGKKIYPYLFTGTTLLNMELSKIPFLWEPYINKQGLTALTGSSDVGKSSFLRQLAINIALKKPDFLGGTLHAQHGRVIYFATEDSQIWISNLLKKQLPGVKPETLEGLCYIFNAEKPFEVIEEQLKYAKTDVVIIDCFADIFDGQMNDVISMRRYLNKMDKLSLQYDCAFIFLHHTGKRTENGLASKNNILGSQGFEAKMRLVMELRKSADGTLRYLWFTKGNYLPESQKKDALELEFDDKQEFTFTGNKTVGMVGQTSNRTFSDQDKQKIMEEVTKHLKNKLSIDKILEELKKTFPNNTPSKGTLHKWITELKVAVQSVSNIGKSPTEQASPG